jgi:hypothetical protein
MGEPLALAVLRVHAEGDLDTARALLLVANELRAALPPEGVVLRETRGFVVLLPGARAPEAAALVAGVRSALLPRIRLQGGIAGSAPGGDTGALVEAAWRQLRELDGRGSHRAAGGR